MSPEKIFVRFLPQEMRKQAAILLILLVVAPLCLLGFLLIRESRAAVKTAVLKGQAQLAIRAASDIEEFMERSKQSLEVAASLLGTKDLRLWDRESLLVQLALDDEIFERVSLVGEDGRELVTSQLGGELRNYAALENFIVSGKGVFYRSPVYISTKEHVPYMILSAPVTWKGKVTGVVIGWIDLRGLWSKVDQIRTGRTGRAYLVSEKGVLLAHEDKKKVISCEDVSRNPEVVFLLSGKEGSGEFEDAAGRRYLGSYALLRSLGWGIVIRQDSAEAYSFMDRMTAQSVALILTGLVLSIAFSFWFASLMVSPIQLLADKMRLVAKGNLDQRLPFGRKDEIGGLMRTFNQMTRQLKEARRSEKFILMGRAASAITHELKNALSLVSTYAHLMPERRDDPAFIEKMSEILPREVGQWEDMLDEIYDYSKRLDFPMTEFDPKKMIGEFLELVEHRLERGRIRFVTEIPPGLPRLYGNEQKLKQVLMNFAVNAIDAMPDGGTLTVRASESAGLFEIAVTDTGCGIPEERIGKIFEPFFTSKPNGLGLGLAISKEIVEKHCGTVEVASRPGAGASFRLKLPFLRGGLKPV